MSNDWIVFPQECFETLSSFSNEFADEEYPEDKPHAVAWTFPTKADAQTFAVKVEYIHEHNINLAAASIFLDTLKALGTDSPTRVALAAIGEGVKTQLKLNRAMALLEQSCNGNLELVHKVRSIVEKI